VGFTLPCAGIIRIRFQGSYLTHGQLVARRTPSVGATLRRNCPSGNRGGNGEKHLKSDWMLIALMVVALAPPPAWGADVKRCWTVEDKIKRADCYDEETGRPASAPAAASERAGVATLPTVIDVRPTASQPATAAEPARTFGGQMSGLLAERWGYNREPKDTRYDVRLYDNNYIIVRNSNNPNTSPSKPGLDGMPVFGTVPIDVEHPELKFQLSLKARVFDISLQPEGQQKIEDALGLWLAYTQQSHWQAFNSTQSSPFRETNYQPEAIVSIHPHLFGRDSDDFAWHWRVFNVGFGHQSNGQDTPLSRSWNYLFAQLGFEYDRGDSEWAVVLRPWYRIPESRATDDNRDLIDYYGYGDIRATYRGCNLTASLMVRGNPGTGKGAGQLDLSGPFIKDKNYPLEWYVQVFTGYGESLIDYNWRQTTAGIGVRLNDRPPASLKCG
jgi:phospholipase A1